MRCLTLMAAAAAALAAVAGAFGQGGEQGPYQGPLDQSADAVNRAISAYLNAEEVQSIVTPGDFVEWKLNLKAGQVEIAEASSSAFDPALEIVDSAGKQVASNDDRYPGDQRPLLLWRCTSDGTYGLRVRCFHDRSGGEFRARFQTYDSVDLSSGAPVAKEVDARVPFLVRVPMKAGEIVQLIHDEGGSNHYLPCVYNATISASGLPYLRALDLRLQPAIYALVAPVAGDYYVMETPDDRGDARGKVRIGPRRIVSGNLARAGDVVEARATTGEPGLWTLPVKAGEFLEVSAANLNPNCRLLVTEAPDISKFDLGKTETNPFHPHPPAEPTPVVDFLPKRARDGRLKVFRVRRDAILWVATNAAGPAGHEYVLAVKPAAHAFVDDSENAGKLRIADTDYWSFEAKAGDVISFDASSPAFSDLLIVRDPDLDELRRFEPALDQTSDDWRMVVQKPGRYLVSVSCVGNGGGGEYSLARKAIHPKEFSSTSPVQAEIGKGQVQVWKFTVAPRAPVLLHWTSSNWGYDVALYDEKGNRTDFQRDPVDDHNRFGIVSKPQTYLIVLTGTKEKATYSIELSGIPGYRAAP